MNLEIFKNEDFGEIRSIKIGEEIYFVGRDIAIALGFKNPKDALINHVDEEDKKILQRSEMATFENHIPKEVLPVNFVRGDIPTRGLTIINESGVYSLVFSSKLQSAKKFKRWVTNEILPQIRKTGEYKNHNANYDAKNKNAEARLKIAKVKEANFILDTIDKYNLSSISKELLVINALEVVLGENKLPRPMLEQRYYTATEIGNELGVSANLVGKIANNNNLKTNEYGIEVLDKSRYSNKQVSTFRYNENGKRKITELLSQN